jgi:hypothetical protein
MIDRGRQTIKPMPVPEKCRRANASSACISHEQTDHVKAPFIFQWVSRLNALPHWIFKLSNNFHSSLCRHKPTTIDNKTTMEAMREFEQLPMHDSSVIEEAKALIEKLNKMTQASSTHAVHELPHIEPIVPGAHDDDASEFSGYSMVTPSAASKSERDDEKIPLDQQVHAEEQIDSYGDLHAQEFDISGLAIESDIGKSHLKVEGSTTINQPQQDDTNVFQTERTANGKRKLVGIVITFEQGVDFDEGQNAVRFVGDHLGVSVGSQAKEIRVLSIESNGHLEVSTPPHPETGLGSSCLGHEAVELVAKIHRVDGNCRQEETVQGNAPTASSHESIFYPPRLEPVVTAATPSLRAILTLQQTELAKARTLRALLGPNHAACSGDCLGMDIREARKGATATENDRPPTLFELIDVAKTKLHRELTTTHEHLAGPDGSKQISTKKKKEVKNKKAKSTKTKCASTLAYEKTLVMTASILLFAVLFLVFCLAGMSSARRGHFVGLWLGS